MSKPQKKKPGRPKLDESRSYTLGIRVQKSLYSRMVKHAERNGQTVSSWALEQCCKGGCPLDA